MSDAVEGEVVNQAIPVKLTKHPEATVAALEEAFHNAYNITEACHHAGISRVTYYEWLADDDNFSYRMSVAQGVINRTAKEIIVSGIKAGDSALALRYLQLRDPDFKPKAEIVNPAQLAETQEKLRGFFDARRNAKHDERSQPTEPATS